MAHVLIEVSGGVVTNTLIEGEVTVWLRDYDVLCIEEGYSSEDAEKVLPILLEGRGEMPPAAFTR